MAACPGRGRLGRAGPGRSGAAAVRAAAWAQPPLGSRGRDSAIWSPPGRPLTGSNGRRKGRQMAVGLERWRGLCSEHLQAGNTRSHSHALTRMPGATRRRVAALPVPVGGLLLGSARDWLVLTPRHTCAPTGARGALRRDTEAGLQATCVCADVPETTDTRGHVPAHAHRGSDTRVQMCTLAQARSGHVVTRCPAELHPL